MTIVVAYKITDLLFRAKIEKIAVGCLARYKETLFMSELEALEETTQESIVIVFDLMNTENDLKSLSSMQSGTIALIGFYPHVEKEAASKAIAVGIINLVPRSALETKLKSLLRKA